MKNTHKIKAVQSLCVAALALLSAAAANAREPGVLTTVPPGASMGVPIAAWTPVDGIFISSRTGLSDQSFFDAQGNETPTGLTIRDTVLQVAIVPGQSLFGGKYRAFLSFPFVDIEGENIATPVGPASGENSGMGSIEIRPIDVSWQLNPEMFVSAGVSLYTASDWEATQLVNPGQNFHSVSPSIGYSYMHADGNATAHLMYFSNVENEDNGYKSGDEAMLNLTVMKNVGKNFSFGAIGYWRQQITDDKNPDGAYGGLVAGRGKSSGIGFSVTKQLGPINLNAMYTTDIGSKNSGGGDRLWFNVVFPIHVFGR